MSELLLLPTSEYSVHIIRTDYNMDNMESIPP